LDLKEKYVDIDVLKALKMSVEKNLTDPNNVSIHKHKQKVLKLLGRITSIVIENNHFNNSHFNLILLKTFKIKVVANWKIYWYYGDICLCFSLAENKSSLTEEDADKVFNLYLKGFRNLYNQQNWELTIESCDEVLTTSIEIILSILQNYIIKK